MTSQSKDITVKKFVSEDEIEDKKKRRQEEWEKTRTPDQPLECPEEVVDTRSLFDRLAEQKQKKEDEFEEQHRLSNQVKGLAEDEVAFLDHVSQRQQELAVERLGEEQQILQQMQESTVVKVDEGKGKTDRKTRATTANNQSKSQNALLTGAVKRKSAESGSSKKPRLSAEDETTTNSATAQDKEANENTPDADKTNAVTHVVIRPAAHVAIGVLPGIGRYVNNSSESSNSDSSDMEETTQTQSPYVKTKQAEQHCEQG